MRYLLLFLPLLGCFSCAVKNKLSIGGIKEFVFFLGTYTDSGSKGIYSFILKKDGTIENTGLAATTENPSYLCLTQDRKYLLAVNEKNVDSNGTVESYFIEGEKLRLISSQKSGGAHPCFVAVNEKGFVLTANYTGGNIGLLKINKDGKLSVIHDVEQHTGNGPTQRQLSPHVHSVWFEQNGPDVLSVDLGTDAIWFSSIDEINFKLKPKEHRFLKMNPGAGPRHLAFHPGGKWIYVVNELDCTVTQVIKSEKDTYSMAGSFSTLPDEFKGSNTCADIHISNDGKFLYASNRGHNTIAVFSVNPESGDLILLATEPTMGEKPRNFAISPDEKYLLVANQTTDNIVCFERDKKTGLLYFVSETYAPKPVCILFR